jgi:ABC-type Fe3+-hydroxamate transport system substrate-binding protein
MLIAQGVGCASGDHAPVIAGQVITDDFGDTVGMSRAPARIVSLNPTTTELLFALGAGALLVGRTHWDLWPEAARAVPDLGDGLRPNLEAVLATRPDLVLLYAGAENRQAAHQLRAASVATLSLKVDRHADFVRAVELLGMMLHDTARAAAVRDSVTLALERVRLANRAGSHPSVVWPVDLNPIIVIGAGSFLSELVGVAGGRNAYGDMTAPSVPVALEDILRRDPDIIIADSSLARRIATDPAWRSLRAVREGRVRSADPVLMGRPSVRMAQAAAALAILLHTDAPR